MVIHEDDRERWENDGMALTWPVKNPPPEKLEEYAALLRAKAR